LMRDPMPPSRLRAARQKKGWRIIDLKEATGLSRQCLWRLEMGLRKPKPTTRTKLAKALGVPAADLF
jgi:transcriptional regulator with XRE-family HTH domain